ncbi:MAG: hypothetical protein HZC23_13585 [Rhodocyclales bacterium]|nr:hypothetical protein [Rhodocyclales bacterium]
MFPLYSLASLLPEGGQAFAAGLHPEMLRSWLDTLSGMPPEEAAIALTERLKRPGVSASFRVRLKMLDMMAEETRRIAGLFEAELNRAHHPLSTALQRKVVIGNDLLKYHAQCYRAAVDRLKGGWISRGKTDLLRRTLAHAMDMERRRLVLAYRAYAPGSKSAWRSLHALHRGAPTEGHAAPACAGAGDSPRHLYVKTLLLALAEPVQMAPGELDRARFYLDRYAGLAELKDLTRFAREPSSREGCFLIRQDEEGPGRSLQKWHNIETRSGDLLLDCGPLLKKMRSQIDALEHGVLPSKIGLPSVAHRPQYLAMMKNLLMLWSDPPSRRSPRQHFKPRVEIAAGLDDLWTLLSGAALKRRRDDSAPSDAAAHGLELSEWSVTNESPTGFALQYLNGESSALSVGALVGVRSQDRSKSHICLVRRLVSGDRRRAELGLQKYAPFAVPTLISWSGSAAAGKPPARAIVLPRVPSLDGAAAVIVAPHVLRSGKRVPFVLDGRNVTRLAGAPVERCAGYEIFSLGNPD